MNSGKVIVHIIPYVYPKKGGLTNVISGLINTLDNIRFRNHVILGIDTNESKETVSSISKRLFGVVDFSSIIYKNKVYFILKSFYLLMKIKPKVVHTHSLWFTLFPSVIYKIVFGNVCIYHSFYLDIHKEHNVKLTKKLKSKLVFILLQHADKYFFISHNLKYKYSFLSNNLLNEGKVLYPLKVNSYPIKDKPSLNCISLAWIGNFVHYEKVKGLIILLNALNKLKERDYNARIVLTGSGYNEGDVKKAIKKFRVKDSVVIKGFVADLGEIYKEFDIYTHITYKDSLPLSIAEAMKSEKPVISVNVGGIPEIVIDGKTGIITDLDPESIANSIINLYENKPLIKKLTINSKKMVERMESKSKHKYLDAVGAYTSKNV